MIEGKNFSGETAMWAERHGTEVRARGGGVEPHCGQSRGGGKGWYRM